MLQGHRGLQFHHPGPMSPPGAPQSSKASIPGSCRGTHTCLPQTLMPALPHLPEIMPKSLAQPAFTGHSQGFAHTQRTVGTGSQKHGDPSLVTAVLNTDHLVCRTDRPPCSRLPAWQQCPAHTRQKCLFVLSLPLI